MPPTLEPATPQDLERIPFPSERSIQPTWIAEKHPTYVDDPGMQHELSSERISEHNGHHIRIITTYKIEIDGQPVHLHLRVGGDGHLQCHTTPYTSYPSAMELVKTLIDHFPKGFEHLSDHGSTGDHGRDEQASEGGHAHGAA